MIDFSLTEEQLLLQKTARDFAQKEVKPIAEKLDKNQDAADAVIPIDLYKKAAKLGFTNMLAPQEYGGVGLGELDWMIILEEFAAADAGFAGMLNDANATPLWIFQSGSDVLRKRVLDDFKNNDGLVIVATSSVEPDAGGIEMMCQIPDPKLGFKTYAKREGDEYVINGTKAGFCVGAGMANYYSISCRTDLTKPPTESTSRFIIPAGTPGFSIGKLTNKMGWRSAPQAEIYLDDVRIPKEYLLGEEGKAFAFPPIFSLGTTATGAISVGIARAAFEYAVAYAKQRVTWGEPIIKRQAIATMLADMQIEIEAGRLLLWQAAWTNDYYTRRGQLGFYHTKAAMQKVYCAEMAIQVTQKAIAILGGYGVTTDFPLGKYLRDALTTRTACFSTIIFRLHMAEAM